MANTQSPLNAESGVLLHDGSDRIATMTLNRPRQRNAMTIEPLDRTKEAFTLAEVANRHQEVARRGSAQK
jgi:enoyl-CoA hydratase/carnithine racemase